MAAKMEGGDRRFSVVIELRASAMCCTAYFAHPDRITYCAICGCIPDVLHILDNDAPLCKRCFRGVVGSNPLKGSSEPVTPQRRLRSVTCNEAFRDAFVTCPECCGTGRYVEFKEHIKAVHPQLWHCGQQQQAYNAQRGKEVGPPPGFQSQHQAAVKPFDVIIDMEELQNCTEKSAPQEAATITLPSDCEVTFQTGCGHTSISSAEKGGQETGKRANSESKTDECTGFSKCLDPNRTEEQNEDHLVLLLDSQRWFQKQLLKYYNKNLKGCYEPTEKDDAYFQHHVERCQMVPSTHLDWFLKALSKYRELRNKHRLGCDETCSSFMEHAKHSEEFLSEVKALSTNEMFRYYQEHTKGCPGSTRGKSSTENRSSSEPMELEEEAKKHEKPSSAKPEELSEYHQCKQTNTQEHLEPLPHSPEADIGVKTKPPAEVIKCKFCSEGWNYQEIEEHMKHCSTYRRKCTTSHSKVAVRDYHQHCDHEYPGDKQTETKEEEAKGWKTDGVYVKEPATQEVDKQNENENGETEVESLNKKIKELEERLEEIEEPLLKLIERLFTET
ncbi:uncharacterized protein LOC144141587 [Haemaphysalis longicornis]